MSKRVSKVAATAKAKPPRTATKPSKAKDSTTLTTAKKPDSTLKMRSVPGKTDEQLLASLALQPVTGSAFTALQFAKGSFGDRGVNEVVEALRETVETVKSGNLSHLEATLTSQATVLDKIFQEMARRAALNMGDYLAATETYMRLALKAQSQCRSTIEALAEIKNPRPVAFVRQANITNGPQQVNNGVFPNNPHAHARTEETAIAHNELSGDTHELLPNTGTQTHESRIDTPLEALAAKHRAA